MRTFIPRASLLLGIVVLFAGPLTRTALATGTCTGPHGPNDPCVHGVDPGSGGTGRVNDNQGEGSDWTKYLPDEKDFGDAKNVYDRFKDFIPDDKTKVIDTAIDAKETFDKAKDKLNDWLGGGGLSDAERKKLQGSLTGAQTQYGVAQSKAFKLSNKKNNLVVTINSLSKQLQSNPDTLVKHQGKVVTPAYIAGLRSQYNAVKAQIQSVQQEINRLYTTINALRGQLGMN